MIEDGLEVIGLEVKAAALADGLGRHHSDVPGSVSSSWPAWSPSAA
jgi:hypothetical protein